MFDEKLLNDLSTSVLIDSVILGVDEWDLILQHSFRLRLELAASSPPGAVHTHFALCEFKALTAEDVKVDFSDHICHRGFGFSQTTPESKNRTK